LTHHEAAKTLKISLKIAQVIRSLNASMA